jgi:myo-inositol 2-dehydrogenase/D-chiro-inositol 1-dehydrogenase
MLVYYELDMIRRESGCPMLPYIAARWHPAVAQLLSLMAEPPSGIGAWQQLAFERQLEHPDRTAVLSHFAVDVDLCRALVGELTHVSAFATGDDAVRYANLSVQLSGPRSIGVRWSMRSGDPGRGAVLNLVAQAGRAELSMPRDGAWTLQIWRGDQQTSQQFNRWDPAREALAQFDRLVAGESTAPTWLDACRAIELTETIDRSLKRGRTIELHFDEYSEQGTFKGLMTSLGCGLLVAALVIMLLAALGGRLGLPFAQHWASFLLLLFGAFLALQFLRLVFRKP